ncbi:hypothetical protein U9M48_029682 [Paspalum notatum var. saurae]|uniref:Uncharacterized protein n=1 Tax=Paspalum notatum var. saurae TaxID=547442 RepID=A0AAQ3X2F3_PASNO
MAGDRDEDELAALLEKLSLSSASNTDLAFQLQLAETIQACPESSDAALALALHDADLARTELDRRHAWAYHARSAASIRVTAHDALFARDLAATAGPTTATASSAPWRRRTRRGRSRRPAR